MKLALVIVTALGAGFHAGAASEKESAADRGKLVYEKWCTPCHGAGEGKPGTISAGALYKGSKPAVLSERTDLKAAGIKTVVRTGVYVMPRFRKTEVTDADLDAIVAYLTRTADPRK